MYRQNFPDHPGMHNMPGNAAGTTTRIHQRNQPSFLERFKSSLVGIVIGGFIFLLAASFLFWNEGRAVQRSRSLDEGIRLVIPIQAKELSHVNEGQLVHLAGLIQVSDTYTDPQYGIQLRAARVKRTVEMYQWIEHEDKRVFRNSDGLERVEISYSYSEEWQTQVIRSNSFESEASHRNPTSFPVQSQEFTSTAVHIGHFQLSKGLVQQISEFQQFRASHVPDHSGLEIHDGKFYHRNPLSPQVGDVRVSFHFAGLDNSFTASTIGRQWGAMITSYQTESGDTLELLYPGNLSPEVMFDREQATNTMMTWTIRFAGWLAMFVGYSFLTQILITLVDWIPFVREVVTLGVTLMNASLATSSALFTIAMGWIRYRPFLGFTLLACAALPFILARKRARRGRMD